MGRHARNVVQGALALGGVRGRLRLGLRRVGGRERRRASRIRAQIKAGKFPVRLKTEDWNSGKIIWLLDVIAGDPKSTSLVISNFGKVVKGGSLRMHPLIAKMVDAEMLKKLGAKFSSSTKPQA